MQRDKFYARAAREAIRNSLSLAESGESLLSSGKIGPATSLLVLACEEFAKGMMFSSVADGTLSLDRRDLGKKWVVDPSAPKSHALKQLFAGGAFLAPVLAASLNKRWPEIERRISTMEIPDPGSEEFANIVEQFGHEYFPAADQDPEARKRSDLISRLDSLKLAGFYVEVEEGTVRTPQSVSKEDALAVLQLYDEILSNFSERGLLGIPQHLLRSRLPLGAIFPQGQKRPSFARRKKHRESA
ncbi:MAG TPA: AbiV family abortive infection protein [Thermoplasmata archaeon]|nr:AbiV family abortive infection protein [Thermoplasmata archaeon]